jgi:hypothetical protein
MELSLPTPASHPPSQPKCHAQSPTYPPLKYDSKYQKLAKIDEITFLYFKKQRKSWTNLLLATVSLSNAKFGKVKN